MEWWVYAAIGVGAYLLGSLSPALILSDNIEKKDVRKYGSGNAGSTNMLRTFGWKMGLFTFVLDVIKGAGATLLGQLIGGEIGMSVAAVCVIVGHSWPIYYGFHGGKGVASTLGAVLVLMPLAAVIILAVVLVLMAVTRMVSVGSILGILAALACSFVVYPGHYPIQIAVGILTLIVLFGHRKNIVRILNGTENKLNFRRKKSPEK